ncbi:MAG: RimK/LysX family protein [Alphaproteobacteria bacterium]|nr:RimK/LysX family protein [Alphaproteobacteria bacterium]
MSATLRMLALVAAGILGFACEIAANAPRPLGWVEWVRLYPGGLTLEAKLDTGAQTSSLGAANLRVFEREGRQWSTFDIVGNAGQAHRFERQVVRITRVKRQGDEPQPRPVVRLGLCLAGVYQEGEFTIADRSGFDFPVLVGRNLLRHRFAVDPARKHVGDPSCADAPRP